MLTTTLALVAFGFMLRNGYNLAPRTTVPDFIYASMKRSIDTTCSFKDATKMEPNFLSCKIGKQEHLTPDFVIIGDSHAMDAIPAFKAAAEASNTVGIAVSSPGCQPLLFLPEKYNQTANLKLCQSLNIKTFTYIKQHNINNVIFVAKWTTILTKAKQNDYESHLHALQKTIKSYHEIGTTVHFLLPVPLQINQPKEAYKDVYLQPPSNREQTLRALSVSRQEHIAKQQKLLNTLGKIAIPSLTIFDITEQFCDQDVCPIGTLKHAYYYDTNHLSDTGGQKLLAPAAQILKSIQENSKDNN